MLVCLWTLKGGAGCSVTAALAALHRSGAAAPDSEPSGVTLVDPHGDLAAVLGIADPAGAGVSDWLAGGADTPPHALASAATPVAPGLELVGPGTVPLDPVEPSHRQVEILASTADVVVFDAGCITRPDAAAGLGAAVAAAATRSILVTRACYLALRRVADAPVVPSGVVVLAEQGRSLGRRDIEAAVGAPVIATLAIDASVARAVDAGLLRARVPRGAARVLAAVA